MDLPREQEAHFHHGAYRLIKDMGTQEAIKSLDDNITALQAELNGMRVYDEERYGLLNHNIWEHIMMKCAVKELIEKGAVI